MQTIKLSNFERAARAFANRWHSWGYMAFSPIFKTNWQPDIPYLYGCCLNIAQREDNGKQT
jgi:hypothetical protein